jgi:hypothetical protein
VLGAPKKQTLASLFVAIQAAIMQTPLPTMMYFDMV